MEWPHAYEEILEKYDSNYFMLKPLQSIYSVWHRAYQFLMILFWNRHRSYLQPMTLGLNILTVLFWNRHISYLQSMTLGLQGSNDFYLQPLLNLFIFTFSLTASAYIYIEREWGYGTSRPYLEFESSNGRFKLLNMIFILNYLWKLKFIFFWKFLLFFRCVQKH
jgi:hypothetical protein